MILVASYLMGSSGLNLHPLRRVCVFVESAVNLTTQKQAKARIRRLLQLRAQFSFRFFLDGSEDNYTSFNAITEAIPDLIAQISADDLSSSEEGDVMFIAPGRIPPEEIEIFKRRPEKVVEGNEPKSPSDWIGMKNAEMMYQ